MVTKATGSSKAATQRAAASKAAATKAAATKAAAKSVAATKAAATKAVTSRTGATRATTRTTAKRAASPVRAVRSVSAPKASDLHPTTLAIDIGGTGLKASVLATDGRLLADRVRVATSYPCPPEKMVDTLVALVAPLPPADRASAGFPGVVRKGKVLTAPHFVTESGPGSRVVPELAKAWRGFDLAEALAERLGHPVRVANDADLQGWAVVSGEGLEMVVTLGTGVGTSLFMDGRLAPHLELAQAPFRKDETYNGQIGDAALRRIGTKKWRKRVLEAISTFETLVNYDRLYLGGGNARHMTGHIDPSITIVDNVAGILGGIKLWEHPLTH
ncbi:MAG: ROK family protein [Acidimicrobiales bacterium]